MDGTYKSNEVDKSNKLFFKTGLFAEMLAGRSTFINVQVSRIFGSPVLNSFDVDYRVDGDSYSRTANSSINGTTVELGLRKPLNTLKIKRKYFNEHNIK